MLNLLVITSRADTRERIGDLLSAGTIRVVYKRDSKAAAALLERGVFDAVLLVASGASEHALDEIRALRRLTLETPLAVLVDSSPLPWEESALTVGADIVFREPLSAQHIERTLARLSGPPPASTVPPAPVVSASSSMVSRGSLEILRDFSHLLGYSLDQDLFAEQFVQKLREIVGVSRIAVFLAETECSSVQDTGNRTLKCSAAVGIPPDIIECFALSSSVGIGARMLNAPQILLSNAGASGLAGGTDQKIQREFEIMGCVVAIPISDHTRTVGVALLGPHVTGRLFTQDELQLLYLLMEELGSAVKNSKLHRQVTASHRLLAEVMATLNSGCLVINDQLQILHANRSMIGFIRGEHDNTAPFDFAELPQRLADPIYNALVKGLKIDPFTYSDDHGGERFFHVSIIPFQMDSGEKVQSAMLVLEDFTQIEAAKRMEIEASKAKLIALIAKRFAHEIRNSLVPLATHEQLLESEYQSDDFRRSLKTALSRETGRIQRFTEQMLYLAQPPRTPSDTVNIRDLIEECFNRAARSIAPAGKLQLRSESELPLVRTHRPALEHAFQEILTNSLQANIDEPIVTVNVEVSRDNGVRVSIRDNGEGFAEENATRALEPFFTTRNTGIGLGLTVARKILEDHHGGLTIVRRSPEHDCDIEVWLPAASSL